MMCVDTIVPENPICENFETNENKIKLLYPRGYLFQHA